MKNLTKTIWNAAMIFAVALMSFHCDDDNDIENIFTEDNYVNEGVLYEIYLADTLGKLEEQISFYEDIIDNNQGSPEIEKKLDQAIFNKNYFTGELDGNEEWVKPAPPCPGVLINGDDCPIRNDIKFITLSEIYSSMSVIFINEQGQQYGNSEPELYQVPDGDGFNYQVLNLNEYSGGFTMKIEKVIDNTIISYEYNGTME